MDQQITQERSNINISGLWDYEKEECKSVQNVNSEITPLHIDNEFEFDAPKYFDFGQVSAVETPSLKQYFETHCESPSNWIDEENDLQMKENIPFDFHSSTFITPKKAKSSAIPLSSRKRSIKSVIVAYPINSKTPSQISDSWIDLSDKFDSQSCNNLQDDNTSPIINFTPVQNRPNISSTEAIVYARSQEEARRMTLPRRLAEASRQNTPDRRLHRVKNVGFKRPKLTRPKPFKFATDLLHPKQTQETCKPFVPLALQVQQFLHTPRKKQTNRLNSSKHSFKTTIPQSPMLLTKSRIKHYHIQSTEERELEELQKIAPFKAHPINSKVLNSSRPLGVPAIQRATVTIPMSPAITKPKPRAPTPSPPRFKIRANPVRKIKFTYPHVEQKQATQLEPFNLKGDAISERKLQDLQERIKKERKQEKQLREFHAHPIESRIQTKLPIKKERPLTEPKPFHLATEERRSKTPEIQSNEIKAFQAQPIPMGHADPFMPKRSEKPLTVPEDTVLHSDLRAIERAQFDSLIAEKQRIEQVEQQRLEQARQLALKKHLKVWRRQLVHHARSPLHIRPLQIQRSTKSLTVPESPLIGSKRTKLMQQFRDSKCSNEESYEQDQRIEILQSCKSVELFEKLNRINEGAYGIVYRAKNKKTREIVALKKLKLDHEKYGFPITALREINTLLRAAKHSNIVNVQEIVVGNSLTSIFIVMEFIEHDLKGLLSNMTNPFVASEIKTLMLQLLSGVHHLHSNWIVHRDLKTSNLLLNNRGQLKIADFGLARRFSDITGRDGGDLTGPFVKRPLTCLVVTLWYRAPELLLGCKQYAIAVDMWSIGCIFAELILREPLFAGRGELDQIDHIFKLMGRPQTCWPAGLQLPQAKSINWLRFPENCTLRTKFPLTAITNSAYTLLVQLLSLDPVSRITCKDALQHDYFKENPPPKDPAMFPTFPSVANGETIKKESPCAPMAGHGYVNSNSSGNSNLSENIH